MDDHLNAQLKDELREITRNIDAIIEKIRTFDPVVDGSAEAEKPTKPET